MEPFFQVLVIIVGGSFGGLIVASYNKYLSETKRLNEILSAADLKVAEWAHDYYVNKDDIESYKYSNREFDYHSRIASSKLKQLSYEAGRIESWLKNEHKVPNNKLEGGDNSISDMLNRYRCYLDERNIQAIVIGHIQQSGTQRTEQIRPDFVSLIKLWKLFTVWS